MIRTSTTSVTTNLPGVGGEGQIQFTSVLRLCDSVAPLVLILSASVRKANIFDCILGIQNICIPLNNSRTRGGVMKNI